MFSSSTSHRTITKKLIKISIQSPSVTRWESRIKYIVSLRFYLSYLLDALEELQSYYIQKQEGKTADDVRSLINVILSWKFILAIATWHDILFQVNKTEKFMQTCGISSDVIKSEIHTTQSFLQDYRQNGHNTAMVSAGEIAEDVGVESAFVEKCKKKTKIECLTTNQKIKAANCHKNHNLKLTFFAPCRSCHCFTE